jgi:hypothetical protein
MWSRRGFRLCALLHRPECNSFIKKYTPPHNMYIARTSSGDMIQIRRDTSCPIEDSLETHTSEIEMFKVDFDKQDILDIDTLKDDALFIGHNYSCCLSANNHPRLLLFEGSALPALLNCFFSEHSSVCHPTAQSSSDPGPSASAAG